MNNENFLNNRHELVFIYDSKFANPNWDPTENNELRMIGDKLFVTDVRLKRTIRDYLASCGENVFVAETIDENWKVIDVKWRLKSLLKVEEKDMKLEDIKKLKDEFIDIRLFWSAIKMKLTWPVQFNFWESMNSIQQVKVQWTTVFASGEWKSQWTFTEMFISPYSIINFHGIVNEMAAQKTWMDEKDLEKLKDGIWNWTKNLITRSKFEQLPRILVDIKFLKDQKTHIWELDSYISLEYDENKYLDNISQASFNFEKFAQRVKKFEDKIEAVEIWIDERVKYTWLENIKNLEIKTI